MTNWIDYVQKKLNSQGLSEFHSHTEGEPLQEQDARIPTSPVILELMQSTIAEHQYVHDHNKGTLIVSREIGRDLQLPHTGIYVTYNIEMIAKTAQTLQSISATLLGDLATEIGKVHGPLNKFSNNLASAVQSGNLCSNLEEDATTIVEEAVNTYVKAYFKSFFGALK